MFVCGDFDTSRCDEAGDIGENWLPWAPRTSFDSPCTSELYSMVIEALTAVKQTPPKLPAKRKPSGGKGSGGLDLTKEELKAQVAELQAQLAKVAEHEVQESKEVLMHYKLGFSHQENDRKKPVKGR